MGYSCYTSAENGREQGYAVPAVCDHPDCTNLIDRGMGYVCLGDQEHTQSCGGFYCSDHQELAFVITEDEFEGLDDDESQELAESYGLDEKPEFDEDGYCHVCQHKPIENKESRVWLEHIMKDESWQKWRDQEPARVERIKSLLADKEAKFFKIKNLTEGDIEKDAIKIQLKSHNEYLEAFSLMIALGYYNDLKPHSCQFLYGHANGCLGVDYFDPEGADLNSPNSCIGYFKRHENKEVTLAELRNMALRLKKTSMDLEK